MIISINRIPKILKALDDYKDLIQSEKITNVCVVYQDENNDVEVDVLGYEPTVEMVGMLKIAGNLVEDSLEY